ncbi:MAG: triose-phosphate isomerase [Opitutales bacterium]|nr:triose-phosphate isomerase [Opitutales bacterium]
MKKYLIAGNWKMNKNAAESEDLAKEIVLELGSRHAVEAVLCPPFTSLTAVAKVIEKSNVKLGAQNMHHEISGAFTGEISPEMLRHLYVSYVILGHSERRAIFGETDEQVNAKTKAALTSRLRPIVCVGETLSEREAEKTLEVVEGQLKGALVGISAEHADSVVIAYEPVWAIGTGKTATPEQAQEVHAFIRSELAGIWDEGSAAKVRILYGGSMKPGNAPELLQKPDIDGGLIGGASLESRSFAQLVKAAEAQID